MKNVQHEMPVMASVFNLVLEQGVDIDKVIEQQRVQLALECSAREFSDKMIRLLSLCPGFIGADPPASENSPGRIVVDPGLVLEARRWLRRRFEVAENIELSPDSGLVFDIRPRCRRSGPKRQKFTGRKIEQFEFTL